MKSAMADDTVRVAVRVRPLVSSEIDRGCQDILNVIQPENQVQVRNDKAFTFNHVFGPKCTQDEFYETAVSGMISKLFKGYNVTILAYGQTGSGKTHSMGTNYSAGESMGVIPRAVNDIFKCINDESHKYNYRVTVSFMELYNEQLYDLLADKNRKDCVVDIREYSNKEIKITGVTEKEVSNADETLQLLIHGSQGRATGSTAMNDQSSRSHAIFSMIIFQEPKDNPANATTAKFHLVDLAGSERSKKTQATGERFKEGVNINKGLLALGNVISQLGDNNSNSFVVYRDSKLTRLLQDSLGGNSITLMIACVSPADYNLEETLSTLRYADRAKKIKNKPIVNQDPKTAKINSLQAEIVNLQLALAVKGPLQGCPPEHAELAERNKSLQKKLRELTEKFNANMFETMCMNERAELAESAKEKIYSGLMKILEEFDKILEDQSLENFYKETLCSIRIRIHELLNQQKKMDAEIYQQMSLEQIPRSQNSTDDTEEDQRSFDDSVHLDEEHAEHTLRQADRNNEVQNINRELAVKEELINRLLSNTSQIAEQTKEVQEMELEIKNLQAERDKLLKTLENVQHNSASAKLAESRRKKLQEFEKKISELTRKCTEQNRIIKGKEKSDQQIKNLTSEIQALKQTRVKLIREMRKESDRFTQYKQQREKELYKLKDQDRKRQNQMARMQNQHSKQQNVYKRKIEEYAAMNKRLKETLELQIKAQQRREKNSSSKEGIQAFVSREIEEALERINCECMLDKYMKERSSYSQLLQKREKQHAIDSAENLIEEMKDLQDVIDLLNVQIGQLQQQLMEADKKKSSGKFKEISSMGDAKLALKTAIEVVTDNFRKHWIKLAEHDSLLPKFNDLEKKHDQVLMENRQLQLREENMKRQMEELKQANEELQKAGPVKKVSTGNRKALQEWDSNAYDYQNISLDESVVDYEDDIVKDPDWSKTPLYKRTRTTFNVINNGSLEESFLPIKRSSNGDIKCSCSKTKCKSRLCSCRKNAGVCGPKCGCDDSCENRDPDKTGQLFFPDKVESNDAKRSKIDAEG
ncbi:chromosome-associated kinesin KIF4 isoform X2 [Cotesia glomerata]|uniref:Kinesin motor domain-containing protein n=1 Tax=Cotesia glomerata TaxID=32391 RepID=A0AAV7J4N9_COTGL|nr:chromosome-associated kinesin KIF4 isoform X1 [Cotesia glomerata]XP_044596439.1 chromosome-associated kinesin KIF4 isoform X2 [Cotesia glomerata]KAH0563992.1 hypothetical protein KQX54_008515 [Cotesia glomerata]